MKKKAYTIPATTVFAVITADSFMETISIGTDDKPASGEAGTRKFGSKNFNKNPWTDSDADGKGPWQ